MLVLNYLKATTEINKLKKILFHKLCYLSAVFPHCYLSLYTNVYPDSIVIFFARSKGFLLEISFELT